MFRIKFLPLRAFALIVAILVAIVFGKLGGETFDIRNPENCKLHFTIISDVHVETNNWKRYPAFTQGLQNVPKNKSGNDAIVDLVDSVI